jgi:hypothetical protein
MNQFQRVQSVLNRLRCKRAYLTDRGCHDAQLDKSIVELRTTLYSFDDSKIPELIRESLSWGEILPETVKK